MDYKKLAAEHGIPLPRDVVNGTDPEAGMYDISDKDREALRAWVDSLWI